MTPHEMREIALKAAQPRVDEIIETLKERALKGEFSLFTSKLPQAAQEIIKGLGYSVEVKSGGYMISA